MRARVLASYLIAAFLVSSDGFAMEWNGIDLRPYAGVMEIYDDNVTFRKDDPIDDFITSLAAGLSAQYETQLTTFHLDGTMRYEFFVDHDEFDNLSGELEADWKQELSKYDRLRLRDSYLHSDEARSFADVFNRAAGRFSYELNKFNLDYEHDFTSQWSGTARYANEFTIFSTNLYNDSYLNGGGTGAVYHLSSSTHFLFDYDFKYREFSDDRSATTHTPSVGIRQYLTQQLYFDGRVGLDFIDAYDGENLEKPLFQAKLTADLDKTATADVGFEKAYSLNSYTEDVFDHWQVSSSLRKEFTRRLDGSIAVFYGDGRYVASDREDEFFGIHVGAGYALAKNWRATLRYTFTNVDSTNILQEYQKNTVLLGLTWNF